MTKIALVTGGSAGIGRATAKLLKQVGYSVTITGRHPERLRQAAHDLGVAAIQADMSKLDDIDRVAEHFTDTGLDALVNNAGVARFLPIEDYDEAVFQTHFDTNVRGPLFLIKALLPALKQRGGAVTTVSSQITEGGGAHAAIYAGTKGAVNAFTRSLALELAPVNIRINAVAPGPTQTALLTDMGSEVVEATLRMLPLKRLGTPEEIAHVIVAQLASTNTTGAIWKVDGGMTA